MDQHTKNPAAVALGKLGGKKGGPKKKRRTFIGVLPAIPIEVVGP